MIWHSVIVFVVVIRAITTNVQRQTLLSNLIYVVFDDPGQSPNVRLHEHLQFRLGAAVKGMVHGIAQIRWEKQKRRVPGETHLGAVGKID